MQQNINHSDLSDYLTSNEDQVNPEISSDSLCESDVSSDDEVCIPVTSDYKTIDDGATSVEDDEDSLGDYHKNRGID